MPPVLYVMLHIKAGSGDNISVLVVEFNWQPEEQTPIWKQLGLSHADYETSLKAQQEQERLKKQKEEQARQEQIDADARLARRLQEEQ